MPHFIYVANPSFKGDHPRPYRQAEWTQKLTAAECLGPYLRTDRLLRRRMGANDDISPLSCTPSNDHPLESLKWC